MDISVQHHGEYSHCNDPGGVGPHHPGAKADPAETLSLQYYQLFFGPVPFRAHGYSRPGMGAGRQYGLGWTCDGDKPVGRKLKIGDG
jgi:hypothetical protein